MKEEKRFTLDNNTTASNPGRIKFEPLTWFLHRKLSVLLLIALLVASLALSVKISYWLLILSILLIFLNALYWVKVKEHYTADSNPGLIISESPPLFAVYTDLGKWGGSYPAVKVMNYCSKLPVQMNMRLATVSVYSDEYGDDSLFWSDFHPLPVEYATTDQDSIQNEMQSYCEEDWQRLMNAISQLPERVGPGLYRLKTSNDDWSGA